MITAKVMLGWAHELVRDREYGEAAATLRCVGLVLHAEGMESFDFGPIQRAIYSRAVDMALSLIKAALASVVAWESSQ